MRETIKKLFIYSLFEGIKHVVNTIYSLLLLLNRISRPRGCLKDDCNYIIISETYIFERYRTSYFH